ncbi:alpha-L-rhamnosidase [Phototrophicus methaneseepsis]|uniref:Alpha-L-rhamnosidase n=1 Tax=Phototrophicus methaneseepsis TaxID=2710758 RepID=A0A7S8ED08_9CHLR|nr:alpha-L-rhamnosidase C-terminal domain-containing protein [Phototrophicus methaneseepsis]QPC84684.1 alpha-L-rhamnosidase [Phototrophicus methaneseepsis]
MKVLLNENPLAPSNRPPSSFSALQQERPAWIRSRQSKAAPEVTAFRLQFSLPQSAKIRTHVSADERYILYLDGEYIGRGPERGSEQIWFYETYDLDITAGAHTIVALVWRLGEVAPKAQISLEGGFLLEAEGPYGKLLSTKSAVWETMSVNGIRFEMPVVQIQSPYFAQPTQTTDGSSYPWGIETGEGDGWEPAIARHEDVAFAFGIYPVHKLHPALLPAQMAEVRNAGIIRYVSDTPWGDPQVVSGTTDTSLLSEEKLWQTLLDESIPLEIPPHTQRQIVIDLEQYVCAYPQIEISGGRGSQLIIGWAEALYLDDSGQEKGQRDEVEGRTFIGLARDVFMPNGGESRKFEPLWWRAGRFIQILIETGEHPLTLERFSLLETRYPLEMESRFTSSDARLEAVTPIMLRGLQMCAHETYMDCPYYEQMMYVGDARLEALTTYVINADDRLPRKAMTLFDKSRMDDGFTRARYPGRDIQVIPPFALWWIGMVYDYALWRGNRAYIAGMLLGVRSVLDGFLKHINSDNLLRALPGWNFSDWTSGWPLGVPPDGFDGLSGLLNWHLVYTLGLATQLEKWAGEDLLAQRWQGWQETISRAATTHFWNEVRGLFADDIAHTSFSEHTQCLALLSGTLDDEMSHSTADNLLRDPSLTRTTIYFSHYLLEAFYLLRKPEAFFKRMDLWFDLPAQGFKTTPEKPEPSRSDCHGWGAHPLYHYFATLLGIRPALLGFEQVAIAPMPGHLTRIAGEMAHPNGVIQVDLHFEDERVWGQVSLPHNVIGTFCYAGKTQVLKAGSQQIDL